MNEMLMDNIRETGKSYKNWILFLKNSAKNERERKLAEIAIRAMGEMLRAINFAELEKPWYLF
jgi:hypothetical protein